jgi:hypothetical protein
MGEPVTKDRDRLMEEIREAQVQAATRFLDQMTEAPRKESSLVRRPTTTRIAKRLWHEALKGSK